MKKSELKSLIREVVNEALQDQTKTYKWNDGTEVVLNLFDKVVGGKYKGQELDVSDWKDFGWANGWAEGFYEKTVAPSIKGDRGYEIKFGSRGTDNMYLYPESKVSYRVDSSD